MQATPVRELPEASLCESLGFTALVILPNVVQGLFRRRPRAVLAATKLDVDRWAVTLIDGIRRAHDRGPVWVRALQERALLVVTSADVARVLEASPHPFAADPQVKRRGMSHFQPDALTLSRGEQWENRRLFTEDVLDSGRGRHRLADRFGAVARDETQALIDASGSRLGWQAWHAAFRRLTRRIVLGDAACHDEHVTDLLARLMDEANRLPAQRSERFEPFMARLASYVQAAEPGSLVGLFPDAPADDRTAAVGQVPHWLFALADTLAMNTFRALALLASHPAQRAKATAEAAAGGECAYLEACLEEAMRLWPTTSLLVRETLEDVDWDGMTVPAGTNVLIVNTFNHRDPTSHPFSDTFSPKAWTHGGAHDDWAFNHFSRGPQGCPGAALARFVGGQVLAAMLSGSELRLLHPRLDASRALPHMVDVFRIRFALNPRTTDLPEEASGGRRRHHGTDPGPDRGADDGDRARR